MNKLQELTKVIQEVNRNKEWTKTKCYNGEEYSEDINITLEDCLIALCENNKEFLVSSTGDCYLKENGDISVIWITDKEGTDSQANWTINKPLHQQEQETIDLLWDLICKE